MPTLSPPPAPLSAGSTGRLAELAAICARPLPDVPENWLTNRWHGGAWAAHTDRILTHPAYRDIYTWVAAAQPSRHEHWELMAAVAVTHAHDVAGEDLTVEGLDGLIGRTWRGRTMAPRHQYVLYNPAMLADRLDATVDPASTRTLKWASSTARRSPTLPGTSYESVYAIVCDVVGWGAAGPDVTEYVDGPSASVGPRLTWSVIDWLVDTIGPGWLTPSARAVLADSLTLVADFAGTRSGFAAPAASVSPAHRITAVLAQLPRPARQAVRGLVFGPAGQSPLAGNANSLLLLAANTDPSGIPADLVALWRYYAVSLDPRFGLVMAGCRVPRRRVACKAAQHPVDQPVDLAALFAAELDHPDVAAA